MSLLRIIVYIDPYGLFWRWNNHTFQLIAVAALFSTSCYTDLVNILYCREVYNTLMATLKLNQYTQLVKRLPWLLPLFIVVGCVVITYPTYLVWAVRTAQPGSSWTAFTNTFQGIILMFALCVIYLIRLTLKVIILNN